MDTSSTKARYFVGVRRLGSEDKFALHYDLEFESQDPARSYQRSHRRHSPVECEYVIVRQT